MTQRGKDHRHFRNRFVFMFGMLLSVLTPGQPLRAEIRDMSGRFGGLNVNYKVVLPPGYDASRTYPLILAFSGGSQTMNGVVNSIERTWRKEAERRGYIVVSPAAPEGELLFQFGDLIFPSFLNQILQDYKVQGGKIHIAGSSNGGITALHVASLFPRYFRSVTAFPGYLPLESRLDALAPLCLYLHVGELDTEWVDYMTPQVDLFRQKGMQVHFAVEKGEPHGIRTLAGDGAKRLFDQFEEAARDCN